MKYIKLIILIIIIISLNDNIFAQPKATVQFVGGYSLPLADLKGNFGEIYSKWTGNGNPDTNTFFMKSGINYGILVKFPIKKKSNINIIGGVAFDSFNNTASYNDSTGTADYDLTQSVLGITLGAEYNFNKRKSKLNPFFGAEFSLNIFGGKLKVNTPSEATEFSMNSTTRYGFQVGGGIDYVLHNNVGIVVGAKYSYSNLVGKEFINDIGKKYNLNDGEHSSNGSDYPEKKVTFVKFYGGLSFYFGR